MKKLLLILLFGTGFAQAETLLYILRSGTGAPREKNVDLTPGTVLTVTGSGAIQAQSTSTFKDSLGLVAATSGTANNPTITGGLWTSGTFATPTLSGTTIIEGGYGGGGTTISITGISTDGAIVAVGNITAENFGNPNGDNFNSLFNGTGGNVAMATAAATASTAGYANTADTAGFAYNANTAGTAYTADTAGSAYYATYAENAGTAVNASNAAFAGTAGIAENAAGGGSLYGVSFLGGATVNGLFTIGGDFYCGATTNISASYIVISQNIYANSYINILGSVNINSDFTTDDIFHTYGSFQALGVVDLQGDFQTSGIIRMRTGTASLALASLAAQTQQVVNVAVANAVTTNVPTIAIGVSGTLPAGVVQGVARVVSTGTVAVPFFNANAATSVSGTVTLRVDLINH